jgi:drug/metabolite transporter (DMT)-like permease
MSERLVMFKLLGVSLLWGCNYVASAYLLKDFSPVFLSYSRLLITSLFLLSIALIKGGLKRPKGQEWILLGLAGIFGTLLNQLFYFKGLMHSTAGTAALIIALSPIATTFLARIFLKENITWFKLIGATLALSGVGFIVLYGGKSIGVSMGDLYILLAMLTLSISLLFTRKLTISMPSYDVTIYSITIGTLFMTPAAVIEFVQGQVHIGGHLLEWIILISAAVFGQGLAGFWWNQGISVIGASASSMFMNIPPFVAIIVAFFVLGDPIQFVQVAGGILILLGVAISNKKLNAKGLSH